MYWIPNSAFSLAQTALVRRFAPLPSRMPDAMTHAAPTRAVAAGAETSVGAQASVTVAADGGATANETARGVRFACVDCDL